jgi:hypothetical protein
MNPPHYSLGNGGIAVVTAVNDDAVFNGSLMRSPEMATAKELRVQRGCTSAGQAYNAGIRTSASPVMVFAHQDIFFPEGWFEWLSQAIRELTIKDPRWGVLGVYGIGMSGQAIGHIYSTGMAQVLGHPLEEPQEARSLDEVVLVVRRSSGLQFDEALPGFHLYGTDICLQARNQGFKCYVVSGFCIHNSNGLSVLPAAYTRAFLYLRRKWRGHLPIQTPCMPITQWGIPLLQHNLAIGIKVVFNRHPVGKRCADPSALYHRMLREGGISSAVAA